MFRTDTGNFNRLLTSLGLILMAAALVIPYFYFRDTGTLRVPRSELRALTDTGREALERRQGRIADFELPVLIFSGLLLASGGVTLFFGGKRLRTAQRKEDAAIDRQAQREDYEIKKQTAEEVAGGRDAEAREDVERRVPAGTDEQTNLPTLDLSISQVRNRIATAEEKAQQFFREADFGRFEFLSKISIVTGFSNEKRIRLDGLFQARRPNQPDVALELKAVTVPTRMLRSRLTSYSDQLLALLTRYENITGKEALGWLLIVMTGDAASGDSREWRSIRDEFDDLLAGRGRCTVMAESELKDAPNRFRQIFGD